MSGLLGPDGRDLMPEPEHLTIPLRFAKSQARVLDAIIGRLKGEGVATENITLFEQAAEAARNAEPLMVQCSHVDEVRAMASQFALFGVKEPSIG